MLFVICQNPIRKKNLIAKHFILFLISPSLVPEPGKDLVIYLRQLDQACYPITREYTQHYFFSRSDNTNLLLLSFLLGFLICRYRKVMLITLQTHVCTITEILIFEVFFPDLIFKGFLAEISISGLDLQGRVVYENICDPFE